MAFLCGVVGCGVGFFIGTFAPDAYRFLLYQPGAPEYSTVQFGVGQGLIQGLMAGAVLGVAVVWILAWREVRLAQAGAMGRDPASPGD